MSPPGTVKIALAATYLDGSPARGVLQVKYDGGPMSAGNVGSKGPRGAGAGVFYVTTASQKSQFVCTRYTDDPWPSKLPGRPA
ncbi:hypothetical protein [Arthrobacter russicus]|uniref:Uncharacterized protein n=1 Tax=Arthrobacter russicus TaxID=172040 RepID=A0ABU1JE09_9MICC|nr:hypothetical protein [Arthrobacter russicus]MDR6268932.1 hypothetical protein [Arthrobacter russicus]MDR6270583.1 hypothetical protein [Arthrobacter russicus]